MDGDADVMLNAHRLLECGNAEVVKVDTVATSRWTISVCACRAAVQLDSHHLDVACGDDLVRIFLVGLFRKATA